MASIPGFAPFNPGYYARAKAGMLRPTRDPESPSRMKNDRAMLVRS